MSERQFLIVEDDEMIRAAVAGGLRLDGHEVREAATLADARCAVEESQFDLVLLDVGLPDGNGLELLRALRDRGWTVPVLMLTARGSEEDRVLGFEHGCDDYVVKPFSLRELRLRIDALVRRAPSRTEEEREIRIGEVTVDLRAFRVRRPDGEASLSPREMDMLRLFLEHPGDVISRDRFLQEVWGYERSPVTRTVDMHVRKLREKLELDPAEPRHFHTVHGAGYRFDP